MGSRHTRNLLLPLAAACGLAIAAPALQAQQDASPAQGGSQSGDTSTTINSGPQNDPGPVGGVQEYNLGAATLGRSSVSSRLSLQGLYDTNGGYSTTSGASQGDEITSITGGFTLQAVKRNSIFSLVDSTGGLIYGSQSQPNAVLESFNAAEKISLRRWTFVFGETLSYLPNSAFALGGLGFLGGGTTGFNPTVVPTQTIASSNVSELSSATVVQAQYAVSANSSVSVSGTVGFLHFFGSGLLNSRNITARFGYDKSFTARDTFSLSYTASIMDYPSGIPGFTSHYIQVGYRRLLKQRLNLSLSAGPVINQFSPLTGQTTVSGGSYLVSWSASATLNYLFRDGSLNTNYNRLESAGSGYFAGSRMDQLTAGLTRKVSRIWSINFTGGFARNSSLEQTTPMGATSPTSTFNTWYGGGSISRPLGHYSSLQFFYNASRQTGNTTICLNGVPCGPIALTQVSGMSITWSTRPHPLD